MIVLLFMRVESGAGEVLLERGTLWEERKVSSVGWVGSAYFPVVFNNMRRGAVHRRAWKSHHKEGVISVALGVGGHATAYRHRDVDVGMDTVIQ